MAGVSTRSSHSLVWTQEGGIYSFGIGKDGRLGHGGSEDELVPRLIEGPLVEKRVIGASAGSTHSLVWTDEGEVYSFGNGEAGQLGHRDGENELVPRLIEGPLVGKRVIGASAGGWHSLVWTDEDVVYSYGNARYGQLGRRDGGTAFAGTLTLTDGHW